MPKSKFFLVKLLFSFSIIFLPKNIEAQDTLFNWQQLFEQSYYTGFKKLPPLRQYWQTLSTSNQVIDLQPLSYGLDAILSMFEATDNTTYLEDAITITNNVVDSSQITNEIPNSVSVFKDEYRGWIEQKLKVSGVYLNESILSEIYFFQYVTRLLKDIHNNKTINQIPKYQYFYSHVLNFVETNIWDKWETRGIRIRKNKDAYLFLNRSHMASHWAYIATELSFLTTSEEKKRDYLDFVNVYNTNLENNFHKYGTYISWNSTWNQNSINSLKNDAIVQDVSHGNLVVSYLVEAFDLGLWKDSDAIQRLINTLKDKLWDPQNCLFRDNMDGTMFRANIPHSSVGSFQADGFVKLTRYDRSLFKVYSQFISCTKYLTTWYQYGQLFANLALSEKLNHDPKFHPFLTQDNY
jgi:hypothetical protein